MELHGRERIARGTACGLCAGELAGDLGSLVNGLADRYFVPPLDWLARFRIEVGDAGMRTAAGQPEWTARRVA